MDEQPTSINPSKGELSEKERLELATKLDKELDEFISNLEKRTYTEGWDESNWQEEMEKHPFFMKNAPAEGEELNPLLEGIQQLKYDPTENTPEELAASYKEDGNFNYKCKNYRMAIISYSEGLRQNCENLELNANLLNNRAACHFNLKNFRSCYNDCKKALKLKSDYKKCRMRLAQACFELKLFAECIIECDTLLSINRGDQDIIKLRRNADIKMREKDRDTRRECVIQAKEELEKKKVLEAITSRGIKCLGKGDDWDISVKLFSHAFQKGVHLKEGRLVWPVIVMYPEYKTSDFIQEFHEDSIFADHLKELFAERPEWDEKGKYDYKSVRVYFEDELGKIHNVSKNDTLGSVMTNKNFKVDGGVPVFLIFVKDSPAEKHFLKNAS